MGYLLTALNPTPTLKRRKSPPWSPRAWTPLWELCCQLGADDLIDKKLAKAGNYNDGAGLDARGAARLADRLTGIINLKLPEQMEAAFRAEGHTLGAVTVDAEGLCTNKKGKVKAPEQCAMFTAKDVRDLRDFMRDSGGFIIG